MTWMTRYSDPRDPDLNLSLSLTNWWPWTNHSSSPGLCFLISAWKGLVLATSQSPIQLSDPRNWVKKSLPNSSLFLRACLTLINATGYSYGPSATIAWAGFFTTGDGLHGDSPITEWLWGLPCPNRGIQMFPLLPGSSINNTRGRLSIAGRYPLCSVRPRRAGLLQKAAA